MLLSSLTPPYDIIIDQNNNAFIAQPGRVGINHISSMIPRVSGVITHISTEPFKGNATTLETVPVGTRIAAFYASHIHIA